VTAPATPPAAAEATATPPPAATDGTSALPGATAESVASTQAPAAPSATVPPTDSQTAASGATIPSAPALPAAPETTEPAVPQQAAVPTSGGRIQINARLDTWIKITDRNGRSVLNRVLVAGESYTVPDEPGLKMITGNAGGMDILVDGTAIAPLGEPGKVRRDVELDPEKLKTGTAIPQ
jgi:cytoskeleton protein RodZ